VGLEDRDMDIVSASFGSRSIAPLYNNLKNMATGTKTFNLQLQCVVSNNGQNTIQEAAQTCINLRDNSGFWSLYRMKAPISSTSLTYRTVRREARMLFVRGEIVAIVV